MRPRILLTRLVWIVVVALSINLVRLIASRRVAPDFQITSSTSQTHGHLTITPYTLVIESGTAAAGAPRPVTIIKAAQSDGSRIQRLDNFTGKVPVSFRTVALASGVELFVNDVRQERTLEGTKANVRKIHRDPSTDCLRSFAGEPFERGEKVVGREKVLGFDAIVVRSEERTVWLAPALTCAQLRVRTVRPGGEPIDQSVTHVLLGEPRRELFDVPDSYRDVPRKTKPASENK